ncbi:hypothetical protein OSJ57_17655 [Sphingomonas sp. HH69]
MTRAFSEVLLEAINPAEPEAAQAVEGDREWWNMFPAGLTTAIWPCKHCRPATPDFFERFAIFAALSELDVEQGRSFGIAAESLAFGFGGKVPYFNYPARRAQLRLQ